MNVDLWTIPMMKKQGLNKWSVDKVPELGKGTLHDLLLEFTDEVKATKKGFLIRCPWHEDGNPSCNVFFNTGTFYCFVCHGGQKGVSAYKGFTKLGMSKDRARASFLSGLKPQVKIHIDPKLGLPSLDTIELVNNHMAKPSAVQRYDQVDEREPWPEWNFRAIPKEVMAEKWFQDRFSPHLVMLKKERHPRLALAIGGAESFKNTKAEGYLRSEVFLRIASSVKAKAINTMGLNLDPDVTDPLPATLLGLRNNEVPKDCRGLILVEGPYDALRLLTHIHSLEFPFGHLEVVALLGTPQWPNCLKQLKSFILPQMGDAPIILAFDNDAAGIKLTELAIKELQEDCFLSVSRIKVLGYPLSIKDPGDLPFEDLMKCLDNIYGRDEHAHMA